MISFDNLPHFDKIDAEKNDLIIEGFNWVIDNFVGFVGGLSSFAEVTIFDIDFDVFKEELLESVHESFFFFLIGSWDVFELFEKKSIELLVGVELW